MAVAENHGGISTALKLVDIEGKGRGLVASQPLKGGQIVLRDSPILTYSSFSLKQRQGAYSRYCAHCYKLLVSGNGTLACPSCCHPDDAIFCSSKCQSSALVFSHTPWVCQSLSYLRNCPVLVDQQPEDRQIQARYLVAAFNLAMVSPSSFQTLISLDGGGPQGAERDSNAAIFLHSIISSLPFPKGLSAPSVEITAALLSKDRCNSFGLMEPFSEHGERSVRAYAIYRNASFFNHDCLPNACRFDYVDGGTEENTDMIIRMIHDVPEGREICLSYFPVNLSYSQRQKRLLDDYGFSCLCDRCKIEAKWSHEDEDEDEGGEDETMEQEEEMLPSDGENNEIEHDGDDDFPHAYFFVRFVCDKENCGGTLAPLPPSNYNNTTNVMECNACGSLKKEEL
ncbi:histone-lysine N-methyltransferase ASHR2-like [Chenopodium quinoa]|uniref:histone-lysine N-methyltransferase ASHR2-like n=1 Tax=Chenopodium quinoa TaxID=63459 RepID=UPI000B771091|nr:histone-lysine N-methyltransferase ASHR2-like [Chenopodium quinoa]